METKNTLTLDNMHNEEQEKYLKFLIEENVKFTKNKHGNYEANIKIFKTPRKSVIQPREEISPEKQTEIPKEEVKEKPKKKQKARDIPAEALRKKYKDKFT